MGYCQAGAGQSGQAQEGASVNRGQVRHKVSLLAATMVANQHGQWAGGITEVHARDVTGNMETRNLGQPRGTAGRFSDKPPLSGLSGRAWASVGCQSKLRTGTRIASGASKGQSQRAGIGPRSTLSPASAWALSMSSANCQRALAAGVFGSRSGIGSAKSSGP